MISESLSYSDGRLPPIIQRSKEQNSSRDDPSDSNLKIRHQLSHSRSQAGHSLSKPLENHYAPRYKVNSTTIRLSETELIYLQECWAIMIK